MDELRARLDRLEEAERKRLSPVQTLNHGLGPVIGVLIVLWLLFKALSAR